MRYLLDTNAIIFALKDDKGRSALRIGRASHDEVIALTHDLTVVTSNCEEFKRVPGLRVEDWTI